MFEFAKSCVVRLIGGWDPEESAEVEAADGGMLGGLLLRWFAELRRVLGPDMVLAVGVGERLLLRVKTVTCWGTMAETKKSSPGNLMVTQDVLLM